jgi:phosphoserine phosphatase
MPPVLSLIADPQKSPLSESVVADIASAAARFGVALGPGTWLSREEAWEAGIRSELGSGFRSEDRDKFAVLSRQLRDEFAERLIDINVVPGEKRRKKLLLADMDSTMIQQECIDELAAVAGLENLVKSITSRAMNGELEFEEALRERVAAMAGIPAKAIENVISERISFMPGGKTLVATMRTHGAYCALISGGFTQFTAHVAAQLGFDHHQANTLEIKAGKLSGTVKEPILGQDAKLAALQDISSRLGLTPEDALTVGDGANDIPMLREAGLGVALHAKPVVQEAVGIRISHAGLTALLYLQGYSRSELEIAD